FTLPYLAETLTTDVTLYAKFVLESYKVTIFIPNEPSYDIYISEGESLTMDALEVEGYDFGGWYYDEDFTTLFEPGVIEAETTLYALLERIYFTVSFYDWDLTLISTQTVEYGTGAIAPVDPLREDTIAFSYAFTGWDEEYSEVYQNLEIYPLFEWTFKASSVRLLPGIDTLYQGDDWIDGGLELDDEELTYRIVLPPDTETIGRYEVVYEILAGSEVVYEIKRIVNVVELMIDVKIDLKKGITTLPVGAVYEDPGATTNVGTIETSGNVDTFTPGVYEIVYTVRINGWTYSKSRFVHVLETDDYAPVELYWHKEDDEYAL
ncbi:MAG: DUF5011 domain-containing protein, partial [Bacilli bacterium]|nr:DUF5011 domain-containing protein [Bacilli bacterium]